jgi:hypothetical protein
MINLRKLSSGGRRLARLLHHAPDSVIPAPVDGQVSFCNILFFYHIF